jgi:hypothetical protein
VAPCAAPGEVPHIKDSVGEAVLQKRRAGHQLMDYTAEFADAPQPPPRHNRHRKRDGLGWSLLQREGRSALGVTYRPTVSRSTCFPATQPTPGRRRIG